MKRFVCPTLLTFFILTCFSITVCAQNFFPQKVGNCNTGQFCLDCGSPGANYDSASFDELLQKANRKFGGQGGRGQVLFQVLVDSVGNGCVLSHTDASNSKLTKALISYLNDCRWTPAIQKPGKVVSSINLLFTVSGDGITGSIKRIDHEAMIGNMRNPGTPTVYNKKYTYSNPSLKGYEIKVYQKENSGLPQDMSQYCAVDKKGQVWYASLNGIARFDGKDFTLLDESNSPFNAKTNAVSIAVDSLDNKWVATLDGLYKYDNSNWKQFDSTTTGVGSIYTIIPCAAGEILFCSHAGLVDYRDGKFNLLTIPELPADRLDYAYRDSRRRLWIGTFKGSILIDADGKVTKFNEADCPLKNTCITGAVEDERGNLYFSVYAYNRDKKDERSARDSDLEGLIVFSADGAWTHYNDENSGLAANHLNSLFYDRREKILWLSTNMAGLVRFDGQTGWEVWHNGNSPIPSSYLFQLTQDADGTLYGSTYNGMIRIRRK